MPPADPAPLTPEQREQAEALYRELLPLWALGRRQVLLTRNGDGSLSVGSVNPRIDIPATVVYSKST